MENEKITIEQLALMIGKGFSETNEKMEKGFKEINARLDGIENTLLQQHEIRIKRLEDALIIK